MNRMKISLIIGIVLIMGSCAPKITTNLTKTYQSLDYKQEIVVYGLQETEPQNCEVLGFIKVGDSGFTVNCGFETMINKAKMEARKIGGNAIKVIEHKPPNFVSSCHQITVKVLKIDDTKSNIIAKPESHVDTTLNYAILYVYRSGSTGALVSYNLNLGDSVLCRVSNNFKQEIKITKKGRNEIWAKTESKVSLPIDIEHGKEYYIRCGIKMGILVGRPSLEYVDKELGALEYQSVKTK